MPQGHPVPTGSVVPDGSSGSQEQEAAPQRCDEEDGDNGSCDENWNRADLQCCNLWPLGRHIGSRASKLAKQKLAVSRQAHARNLRNKSSYLGMEHPRAAGSGELETFRGGDVVEAVAEAILIELSPKQPAYILNWVGRVTRWTLAGVVDG